MIDYVRQILTGQFEAALCMLNQCVAACPAEHWEGKIASGTFRWVAYHTLFFTDYYLSPSEQTFTLRELHARGGDEREPVACRGLEKDETLAYAQVCRAKAVETIAMETPGSLALPSGFSWLPFSRGELHLYSIRHVQHHAGQMSAFLRRIHGDSMDRRALPWVRTGWR
jgi:hypothetical protein